MFGRKFLTIIVKEQFCNSLLLDFFFITNIFIMCHYVKLHRYIKGKICSPSENRKSIGKIGNILPEVLMTVHFFSL